MRTPRIAPVLALPLLWLVACAGEPSPAEQPPPAAAAQDAQPGDPKVTLLDAGRAPRRELRLRLEPGSSQTIEVEMDLGLTARMEGKGLPPQILPPLRLVLDVTVPAVAANGNARTRAVLREAGVLPREKVGAEVSAPMQRSLARVEGLELQSTLTPRGFTRGGTLTPPPGLDASAAQVLSGLAQSLDQLSAPLPVKPVGVGARWRVESSFDQNGTRVRQTTLARIARLEGDEVELELQVEQTAPPQELHPPGAQAEGRLYLEELEANGQGRLLLDLTRPAPLRSQLDLTSRTELRVEGPEGPRNLTVRLSLATDLHTR